MARTAKRTCTVTGMKTSTNNFYSNQNHVKAVDNMRRNSNDGLHPYSKGMDNLRRKLSVSVDKTKELVNLING